MNIKTRITFWVLAATLSVIIPVALLSFWRTTLLLGRHLPEETVHGMALYLVISQVGIMSVGLLFFLIAFRLVAQSIAKPFCRLKDSALEIASGNLDAPIPETHRGDEIEALADAFRQMQGNLKTLIQSRAEAMLSKKALESELRLAHELQMCLMPHHLPETSFRDQFDLAASMKMAKEVGGDFYDYFLLDDETLCLTIADVSGKGIPAALLMTRCFIAFYDLLSSCKNIAHALDRINQKAFGANDACMFVTMFAMLVHLPTGKCRYVNVGHNPPFIMHRDATVESFPFADSLPLGIDAESGYHEETFQLRDGDQILLYTDGVTEAVDAEHRLFGEDRTVRTLTESAQASCSETIANLIQSIRDFVGDVSQSDDTTILSFRWFSRTTETND